MALTIFCAWNCSNAMHEEDQAAASPKGGGGIAIDERSSCKLQIELVLTAQNPSLGNDAVTAMRSAAS
jgi:hypothetical protein